MQISNTIKHCSRPAKCYVRQFSSSTVHLARHRRRQQYYDILQVRENADQKTIKSQYYRLSKLYHPDLNPGNKEAHQKFLEVNDAYAVLGSESARRQYDMENDSVSTSPTSPGIQRTSPAASWNFKPRASRQSGSSSAQAQAEGFRSNKSTNFNYNEWHARHYEAEEKRRRERQARRQQRENDDAKLHPDSTLWSRFWRMGAIIFGIMYLTNRARELKERPENNTA
ncbi:DnaJ domain-containing protein [Umbelopsis sp. PMI_123]|nr:DnaJ domain-containing protein [Umbelopsis sp. PMI_123]